MTAHAPSRPSQNAVVLALGLLTSCGAEAPRPETALSALLPPGTRAPIALENAGVFSAAEQRIVQDAAMLAHTMLARSTDERDQAKARFLLTMRIRCEPGAGDAIDSIDAAWFPREGLTRVYRSGVQDPLRLTLTLMHESLHAVAHGVIEPSLPELEKKLLRHQAELEAHTVDLRNADNLAQYLRESAAASPGGPAAQRLAFHLQSIRELRTSDDLLAGYHGACVGILQGVRLLVAAHDKPGPPGSEAAREAETAVMTSAMELLAKTALDPVQFLTAGGDTRSIAQRIAESVPSLSRYTAIEPELATHLKAVQDRIARMTELRKSMKGQRG